LGGSTEHFVLCALDLQSGDNVPMAVNIGEPLKTMANRRCTVMGSMTRAY
jgi:hypothetical protein